MKYSEFLSSKKLVSEPSGIDYNNAFIASELMDYQDAIVKWALKRGKAAVFADTGMGKTFMQLAWAEAVFQYTGNRVLIVAPLCVAKQTINESKNIDMSLVRFIRETPENGDTGVFVTNYEMIENIDLESGLFDGIVLDESSILKHSTSKTREKILRITKDIPYKLSCTATPSPNDFMEMGSQAEFLGVMTSTEMLATFFTHDSGETSKWRLKGHAIQKFWEWVSSWAIYIKKPSDIGFSDERFKLPELKVHHVEVKTELDVEDYKSKDKLSLLGRNKARKDTINMRVAKAAEIANGLDSQVLVWCNLNDESSMLKDSINGAIEVKGSDKIEKKENLIDSFTDGSSRVLVTKPKIAGFGMNWQHCNNMIFVGLNDSYEQLYQAIRRCWRFGQDKEVNVYLIYSDIEGDVYNNLMEKERKAELMQSELLNFMKEFNLEKVKSAETEIVEYKTEMIEQDNFSVHLKDCVELTKELESDSIDYSVFSPPFSSLYTYSNSDRDMGNSKSDDEFWEHFRFLIPEIYRALKPGRNVSVHCMNLTTTKQRDGYIGLKDFRGDIIREFQNAGFIYHSEVTIWKNPVVAMQRTKALGLLWKQIKKDSSMSRQGLPDYVVTFRKPGVNPKPISHLAEEFPVDEWQQLASPTWNDIVQSNTLNKKLAREQNDERHIAPLQLDLIERLLRLWSIPGDLVFSPFTGIGSEGVVALEMGRKFIGSELKESYFKCAVDNLRDANEKFSSYPRGRYALQFGTDLQDSAKNLFHENDSQISLNL